MRYRNFADSAHAATPVYTWAADKILADLSRTLRWGWQPTDWAAAQDKYDAAIIADYGAIRIFGLNTPMPLDKIYTEVYVRNTPPAPHHPSPPDDLETLIWEERARSLRYGERRSGVALIDAGPSTRVCILGKPGAGKTTLLQYLAVREAQRGRWGRGLGKTPIFVSLKRYAESQQSLLNFIIAQFDVCHFPEAGRFVTTLLQAGQAIVLFDGLDEVRNAQAEGKPPQHAMAQALETFALTYGECHVLITGRNAAMDYTFHDSFVYLELADFAPEQVNAFVRAWFEPPSPTPAQQALALLNKPEHASIRDLARNPLLLTLLCLAYVAPQSLPCRRVEIYQQTVDALLNKWDAGRAIRRAAYYPALTPRRKEDMFARIAYDAMRHGQVIFSQEDLQQRLVAHLRQVPGLSLPVDLDAKAILQEVIAQHGIFAEQSPGLYAFAHLTFQEYFAAQHIHRNLAATLPTLLAHIANPRWRETILMTASLLPDATVFLTQFANALTARAAQDPSLATLLHALDRAQPLTSFSANRPRARALLLAFTFDFVLTRARTLYGVRRRARARTLAHDLEPALAPARTLARDLDPAHAIDPTRALDPTRAIARDLEFVRDLADALIMAPPAPHALPAYLRATHLFHACLQVAYTDQRRSLEARILEPPLAA